MFDEIDKSFEAIKNRFRRNGNSIELITKAYDFAKKMHSQQTRYGGQPYIIHPVSVATILSDLDYDEDVICGALLHDVVEDCNVTLDELQRRFNRNVAQMVDTVSAIDKENFVIDSDDIFEDTFFEKASIDEQSFKKLIALGKRNQLGFCIKFADRLDNLRSIDCFPYAKQLEKVKETERWIIPIARALNAEYFYRAIKNECFKIMHRYDGEQYFFQYSSYHNSNRENINLLKIRLQEIFASSPIKKVKVKDVREYKVFEDIRKLSKNITLAKVSQGQILKVTNYNIYLLYEKGKYGDMISNILQLLMKNIGKDISIIDAKVGNFTKKPYLQLEDKFKNKYNLYIMSTSDYVVQRSGTLDGQDNDILNDENLDNLDTELIKVKTRSGENRFIPKGSTALDFAFKIHKDIGFGFKYAIINNSKTKFPPYTKLYEGDQVEIIVDKDGDEIKNIAELKWFAYVNSDLAKKCLIKHFEKL